NDPPSVGDPQLHVFRDGFELALSPYGMVRTNAKLVNYRTGVIYTYYLTDLLCGHAYAYEITVHDARGLANNTTRVPGPQVVCANEPPVLSSWTVSPVVDQAGASFTYRVAYADLENESPLEIRVFVQRGGLDVGNWSLTLVGWLGAPLDFVVGAWFASQSIVLAQPGFNYSYRFRAVDGNASVDSEPIFGPYVLVPPPHVVTVSGIDLVTSLEVDPGALLVPFLQLYFTTSSPEVNVTGLTVNRVGSAFDAEVAAIRLYQDADPIGTLSPNDTLLGARPPLGGVATFQNLGLRVRPGPTGSVSLLLLVDVSGTVRADDTIGLEVRDSSFVTVGPGDVVQSFPPFRSTRVFINVPPNALDLTVNGFASGTAAIQHILGGTAPRFEWRFSDPNAGDVVQIGYNVSVFTVTPNNLVWWHNDSGSAAASYRYDGGPLSRGSSYLVQVSVYDGRLWSVALAVLFRVNTPPPAPTLFAPPDGATGVPTSTTLFWNPVADAEADPIMYWFWLSSDVGFFNSTSGSTPSPGYNVTNLAHGTTYYWKVIASDRWEVTGNATVWQFTTASLVIPVRGEIKGRVINGTAPLAGATVGLFMNGTQILASFTGTDGTFDFLDLDLVVFTVRVGAEGFKSRTLAASPTRSSPVFELGDIPLERISAGPGPGGNPSSGLPPWVFLLIAILFASTIATSLVAVLLGVRRQRREGVRGQTREKEKDKPPPASAAKAEPRVAKPAPPKVATPATPKAQPSFTPPAAKAATAAPPEGDSSPMFACPECGRQVAADAASCVCGVVFES
ncbi:MAG TPA: hypothetical protein VEM95_02840, partial [Thermoplasmata archaeon]|nr:hypothetical protein [Thermoplasmata archaeon]